jgi:hypothetical protein
MGEGSDIDGNCAAAKHDVGADCDELGAGCDAAAGPDPDVEPLPVGTSWGWSGFDPEASEPCGLLATSAGGRGPGVTDEPEGSLAGLPDNRNRSSSRSSRVNANRAHDLGRIDPDRDLTGLTLKRWNNIL